MSGFFERMAERGAGVEPSLRLRPPARFEAMPPELETISELPATLAPAPSPAAPAAGPPEPGPAHDRPLDHGLSAGVPPAPTAAVMPRADVPPAPLPVVRPEPLAPMRAESDAPVLPPPPDVTDPPAPPHEETDSSAPARERPAPPPVTPAERPAPAHDPAPTPDRAPVAAEAPRAPLSRERPPRRRTARTPEVDVVTLLRDHLVPVLVERGVVRRGERPVVVERSAAAAEAPRPGTVSVTPDPVAHEADEPQVNLHIGRIVVTRAPAPAPSAPAPPRQTVDHEAYLARREARR